MDKAGNGYIEIEQVKEVLRLGLGHIFSEFLILVLNEYICKYIKERQVLLMALKQFICKHMNNKDSHQIDPSLFIKIYTFRLHLLVIQERKYIHS